MTTFAQLWCEMAPIDLNLLRTFATLHEVGSFTGAAKRLGVPRSTISRAISALEAQLGEQLVIRTTRTVSISPEGKELFDRVAPSLAGLATALADRPERQEEPSGTLKVTALPDLASVVLSEAVVRFTARYPQTGIELVLTPQVLDLVREGFDLALRIGFRGLPDSTLISQRVGTFNFQLFAAPSYLARCGTPRALRDLSDHDWVGFKGIMPMSGTTTTTRRSQLTEGRIVCNDMFVLREILRRGGGIGGMPAFLAADDLASGTLVPVLPKQRFIRTHVYLVQPARKHVASRVTAFKQLVLEILRQRPLA